MRSTLFKAASLSVALATAGALLVVMGIMTPAHSNEAAYQAAIEGLSARAMNAAADGTQPLSDAFFAAGDTYATAKWPLLDTGYSLLVWAACTTLLQMRGRALTEVLRSSRRWPWLLGLSLVGLMVLAAGACDSRMRLLGRHQLPWWADSVIISMVELWFLLIVASPFVLALTVGPVLARRAAPDSILTFAGGSVLRNIAAALIYALPILISGYLTAQVFQPGGWAISTGGAILCWLIPNGRALMVGASSPPSATPAVVTS